MVVEILKYFLNAILSGFYFNPKLNHEVEIY